eukprot:6199556-Amphidinium_carterae.1
MTCSTEKCFDRASASRTLSTRQIGKACCGSYQTQSRAIDGWRGLLQLQQAVVRLGASLNWSCLCGTGGT